MIKPTTAGRARGRDPVQSTESDSGDPATVSRARLFARSAVQSSTAWIFLCLVAIALIFTMLHPAEFASGANLRNIGVDSATLLIIAVGMTFVIATSGIDLSVGSVTVFAGVIAAKTMAALGDGPRSIILGLVAAVVCGLAWGLVNGLLVSKAHLPPLIVTLGTLGMALGLALLITDGVDVRDIPLSLVSTVGAGRLFGVIPWVIVIALVVAAVGGIALRFTRFGRYTLAIGSNADGARRAAINVDRHLLKVYALCGSLAGLAGFVSLARFATTTISSHATDNLQTIAGVILGGTSLFGGAAAMLGTVVGIFIPGVLQNGFVILGVQPFWQQVAVGAVLIIAVYVDQLRRRRRGRR